MCKAMMAQASFVSFDIVEPPFLSVFIYIIGMDMMDNIDNMDGMEERDSCARQTILTRTRENPKRR